MVMTALGGSAIFQGFTLSSTLGKEWLLELFFAGEGVVAARVGPNTNKLRLDVQSRQGQARNSDLMHEEIQPI